MAEGDGGFEGYPGLAAAVGREVGDGLGFGEAVDAEDEEVEGLAGLPAEALVGVVVGPYMEGGDALEGVFFGYFDGLVEAGPVGEGDGLGFGAVGGDLDVGLEGGLEEFLLLVLVGGKEEEGGVGGEELFALFADAAFAEEEKLAAVLEGGDEGGPFFEGDMGGLGEVLRVCVHGVNVSTLGAWGTTWGAIRSTLRQASSTSSG